MSSPVAATAGTSSSPTGTAPRSGVTTVATAGGSGSPWRRSWLVAVSTWAAAASAYLAVTALSWMIRDQAGPPLGQLYRAWGYWDTGHYLRISQVGYTADRPDSPAFFPLFPLLLRGLDTLLPGDPLLAALVLANVVCIAALAMLHRFAAEELDAVMADRTLLVLMAWPAAFYLCAAYSTSLFLLLSVASLRFMRRGSWWAAGAAGALASATRLTGVLLLVVYAVEYARQRGWHRRDLRWDAAAGLLVPVGLAAYSVFTWLTLGDPLAFSHAQRQWGRHLAAPWVGLAQAVGAVWSHPLLSPMALHNLIDVVSLVAVMVLLGLCVAGPWRLRRDQMSLVWYAAVSLLVVLTGPVGGLFPMQGAPRYAVELVPVFLVLARMTANRHLERLYLLPAVAVQAVFVLTFLNGVWIS